MDAIIQKPKFRKPWNSQEASSAPITRTAVCPNSEIIA